MRTWLQRPYPALEGVGLKLAMSFGIGIVCFLILNIFRPFGLHLVTDVTFLAGFGAIATISLLIHFLVIPSVVPAWYDVERWTIRHQLLFTTSIVLLISILNYFYNSTVGLHISPQYDFVEFLYLTVAVGVLPIIIMTYSTELVARYRNVNTAKTLNNTHHPTISTTDIRIKSESTKDASLSIVLEDFLYATASNNYCEVFYLETDQVEKKLLRMKLKGLEDQLGLYPNILRCHKSYIINKDKITSFDGNARSMTVSLRYVDRLIPVSRSLDRSLLK